MRSASCPRRRDGLHRLTQLIFSKAQPKRLGPQILSGPMLAGLTEAYVDAINNGWVQWLLDSAVARLRHSWHAVLLLRWRSALLLAMLLRWVHRPPLPGHSIQAPHAWLTPCPHAAVLPACSAVPTIATAWQGVAEAESRRAADAALAAYAESFKEEVGGGGWVGKRMTSVGRAWARFALAVVAAPLLNSQ